MGKSKEYLERAEEEAKYAERGNRSEDNLYGIYHITMANYYATRALIEKISNLEKNITNSPRFTR